MAGIQQHRVRNVRREEAAMVSEKTRNDGETASPTRSWSSIWAGYAASVWALVFALLSFYWALGGTAGLESVSPTTVEFVRTGSSVAVATVLATGILKLLGGVFALALVRPWGGKFPRRGLLVSGYAGAIVLAVHGADFLLRGALWQLGFLSVPETVDSAVITGYTFLWGPWWLLGGLLFGVATWNYSRQRTDRT